MSSILLPHEIETALNEVSRRSRLLALANGALLTSASLLAAILIAIGIDSLIVLFDPRARMILTAIAVACATVVFVLTCLRPVLRSRSRTTLARQVEEHVPALQERWTTVTELSESSDPAYVRGSERLIARVAEEAVQLGSAVQPDQIASSRRLRAPTAIASAIALAFVIILIAWPAQTRILLRRFFAPTKPYSLTQLTNTTTSSVIPRGDPVTLRAKTEGRIPSSGQLLLRGGTVQSIDLQPLDADHSLVHEIRSADASFEYSFRAGDGQTAWQPITVADRPSISKAHFKMIPPAYSRLPIEEKDALPMHVRALQGSQFVLRLRATKTLKRLVLTFEDGHTHELPGNDAEYDFAMTLERSCEFTVRLEDDLGLTNLSPPTCRISVYEDQPPSVQIITPRGELAVRPDETLPITFEARDDLGVASAELIVTAGEGAGEKIVQVTPIPLGKQEGEKRVRGETKFDLAPLKLQHGDRLSYALRVRDARQASATGERAADIATPSRNDAQAGAATQPAEQQAAADTQPAQNPAAASQPSADQIAAKNSSTQPTLAQGDRAAQSQPTGARQNGSQRPTGAADANSHGERKQGNPTTQQSPSQQANEMTQRQMPGQATESARQIVKVDKWAGTFEGQAREKLQIAIDDYIQKLDAALADAQKQVEELRQPPATAPASHPPALAKARRSLNEADRTVSELRKNSDGTPYAFMGLQLHDIKMAHVVPAQEQLANVTGRSPGDAASAKDVDGAWYHIRRARELLADLTQKYEDIKRQEKIAETTEHIAKMHRVFLEDTLALLEGRQKPGINHRKNKMIEVSDDFADAVKEYQKQLNKAEAELAKAMGDDPRLLRRFLDKAQKTNLRDELTRLRWREEAVQQQTQIAATRPAEGGTAITREFLTAMGKCQQELAEDASRSYEKMQAWMPAPAAGGQKNPLLEAQIAMGEAARLLHDAAATAAAQQLDRAIETSTQAVQLLENAQANVLGTTEEATSRPANAPQGPSELATFIARRTTELGGLIVEENAAISKMQAVRQKRAGRAVGLEQIQIKLGTADLADRVEKQMPIIQQMSQMTVKQLKQVLEVLRGEIPEEEQEAVIALRAERWTLAAPHVVKAVDGYVRAEKLYDDALTTLEKVIADRAAKMPPQVGQPPSLEQLLEMLKREKENLDSIGAALPRLNLQIISDWALPGEGEGAGGGGQQGQARSAPRRDNPKQDRQSAEARARAARAEADRARDQAQRAHRDASEKRDRMLAEARKHAASRRARDVIAARKGKGSKDPDGADFNIFVSKLDEDVTQNRGTMPPSQYREAIRSYFESISEPSEAK